MAARIERLKLTSRSTPETPALEIASRTEIDAAILLTRRCKWEPGDELTAEEFVRLVADLGGYIGKSSGGPPGSIVIRRGLERVETSARTLEALAALKL